MATSIVSYTDSGKMLVQVSCDYTDKIENKSFLNLDVALLFDTNRAYVYTESNIIEVAISPVENVERVSLNEYTDNLLPEAVRLEEISTISIHNMLSSRTDSFDTQCYLNVPGVKQAEGSKEC